MYSAVPGTFSASRMTRRNETSSDRVLCTSAMFSNPVRPSRISLPYMCMTMSLSSEWITPSPLFAASTWKISQISPKSTIRPLRLGVMSVVKILTVAKSGLNRLAHLPRQVDRQRPLDHDVLRVVAGAVAFPVLFALFDRVAHILALRGSGKVDHRGGAAMHRRLADDIRGRGLGRRPVRSRQVPLAVHMRVDAAGDDDLAGRIDHPRAVRQWQCCQVRRPRQCSRRRSGYHVRQRLAASPRYRRGSPDRSSCPPSVVGIVTCLA